MNDYGYLLYEIMHITYIFRSFQLAGDSQAQPIMDENEIQAILFESDEEIEEDIHDTSDEQFIPDDCNISDSDVNEVGNDSNGNELMNDDNSDENVNEIGGAGDRSELVSDDNRVEGWMAVVEFGPPNVRFTGHCGPIHPPRSDAPPIEYLKLFITEDIVQKMVDQTNLFASQWIDSNSEYLQQKRRSVVHQWTKQGKTFVNEVYAFLG